MDKKILAIFGLLVLICASMCLCFEEQDDKEKDDESNGGNEGEGFKMYEDSFDWADANENSKPLTGLEAINLAVDNNNIVAPGGQFILSTSTEISGKGADKTTGKSIGWQMHFHKPEGDKEMSLIVDIANKGGGVVKDWYESSKIDPWKYADAKIDTDKLPGILANHGETTTWCNSHPEATLTIQTSSGPLSGQKELSWIMWYKDDNESHQVYISAIDGEILV